MVVVAAAAGTAVSAATDRLASDEAAVAAVVAVAVVVVAVAVDFAVADAVAPELQLPWIVAARSLHRHLRWTANRLVTGQV